ncbi:hypothetical protein DER44DRAFT_739053 [Fusarium oxysporum]|nr:hypothetical protein DER44DRAFT_739053 [Fusarium oxysporum]
MPAEQQQREDGYSSVGVPPSEAFEGLAKSYHGWVPRNAKAWIAPKHVHVDRSSIIRHAQAVIGYCGSVVEWILLGRGPMAMPSSLRGPMLIIVGSSSLSRAFWPQCHGLG